MRKLRVAALVAAAVGLGVFAVGCGPLPSSGKIDTSKVDTSKLAATTGKVVEGADKLKELGEKVKSTTDDVNKELDPLKKAFDNLKAKITEGEKKAGTDPAMLKALEPLTTAKGKVEGLLKEITDKLGGLAGLKDIKGLDDAKKAIMDLIEKVKPLLKDYMPAAK